MDVRDWLEKITAAEIMIRDVVTLAPGDTVAQAAGIFLREQVTGAPVIDQNGACLGVLSASDIIGAEGKVADEARRIAESSFWNSNLTLPASIYAEKLADLRDKIAPAAEQPVERFMTTDQVSVSEDTSLATVVQYMLDAHIHRVLVMGAENRLLGIISTTDVLAALLRCKLEQES
jgi:CBS domain-containing membrane protein